MTFSTLLSLPLKNQTSWWNSIDNGEETIIYPQYKNKRNFIILATHLKLISVFNYKNFPHTIFIALFTLKYSHAVQIEQKDNTPNPMKKRNSGNNKIFKCWFYLPVPLPPKPLLHGPYCKGLEDINHFRHH